MHNMPIMPTNPRKTTHFIDLNQKSPKNRIIFEKTFPKLLHEWNIRITFALAFENEANAKSKAKEVESDEERVLWKDYINREVVQEASAKDLRSKAFG